MFKVPWSPGFVLGLPPRGGENSPSDHEIQSIWCLIGIHVDFTSILHSHICSVGPSSIVWIDLGPAPPFLSMRVLEVSWSRALNLVCEVAWNVCTFGWLRPASNDLQTKGFIIMLVSFIRSISSQEQRHWTYFFSIVQICKHIYHHRWLYKLVSWKALFCCDRFLLNKKKMK